MTMTRIYIAVVVVQVVVIVTFWVLSQHFGL